VRLPLLLVAISLSLGCDFFGFEEPESPPGREESSCVTLGSFADLSCLRDISGSSACSMALGSFRPCPTSGGSGGGSSSVDGVVRRSRGARRGRAEDLGKGVRRWRCPPAGTVAGPPLLPKVPGDFEVEAFTISGFDLLEVAGDTALNVLDGPVSLPSLLRTSELTIRGGMTSLALPSLGQTDGLTILNADGLWDAMDESNIAGTGLMLNNGTGLQQCPT
jgi:hypothetical protein